MSKFRLKPRMDMSRRLVKETLVMMQIIHKVEELPMRTTCFSGFVEQSMRRCTSLMSSPVGTSSKWAMTPDVTVKLVATVLMRR